MAGEPSKTLRLSAIIGCMQESSLILEKTTIPPMVPARKTLLGIGFHPLRQSETIELFHRWILERKPRQICLANAYSVSLCWEHPEYRKTLEHSDLVLADGMSIVWGGRWVNVHIPERVAGPDLTQALCAQAQEKGYRLFLLGSSPENLQQLKNVLHARWPKLRISGTYSPSMCDRLSDRENQIIFHRVHESKADILLVGMSAPKQELWIAENLAQLQVPICMGIGAAFDFLSGRIPRAPLFMQRIGMEWLYRLAREPRRLWKRYLLGNFIFLSHLTVAWLRMRFRPASK